MDAVQSIRMGGVIAGLLLLFAAAHAAGNSLSLRITAPDEPVTEADASLKVTMTNTSSRSITLTESNPGCDYTASVTDVDGHLVQLSAAGRELTQCKQRMLLGRRIIVTLKPGASTEDTYPVGWYYGMKGPGTYTVKLQREMPESLGVETTWSNEVTLVLSK